MNCEDFSALLDNYESLTDKEKAEMTEHASMCRKCREELDFYLSIISAARSLPKIEPPEDFVEKLNMRLDAEEAKKPGVVLYHIKRSWKQYAAVAACLAIVAAAWANRGLLLDRVDDDGAVKRETVADNNVGKTGDTPVSPTAPADNAQAEDNTSVVSEIISSPINVAFSGSPIQRAARISSDTDFVQPALQDITSYAANDTDNSVQEIPKKIGDDYGVALAGTINNITKSEEKTYDIRPEEVSAALKASEIKEKYSLLENGESIAFGRYYIMDENGNPIEEKTEAQGIGAIKVSSSDKEKTEEVISQYPHDENGNVYTTNSENLTNILSDLSEEGVEYTDYTIAGSGDVKFRIDY